MALLYANLYTFLKTTNVDRRYFGLGDFWWK